MKGPSVARAVHVSLPRGLARGRARKSWPPVSGTGGAGGALTRRACAPALRARRAAGCRVHLPAARGPAPSAAGQSATSCGLPSRGRDENVPGAAIESFAALAQAWRRARAAQRAARWLGEEPGAAPGKREAGGTVSRRSRVGATGRADVVPGAPSAMPPQLTPNLGRCGGCVGSGGAYDAGSPSFIMAIQLWGASSPSMRS